MIILELNKFNLIVTIARDLETLLPHTKITSDYLRASTALNKKGIPITQIDSKEEIAGIMLKFRSDCIEIKSLINRTGRTGLGTSIMKKILGNLEPGFNIIVDQDVSGGYWDKLAKNNPEFKWIFQ